MTDKTNEIRKKLSELQSEYDVKYYRKRKYKDDFPFFINSTNLDGQYFETQCCRCKEKVIAYYEFERLKPVCPQCMWETAKFLMEVIETREADNNGQNKR